MAWHFILAANAIGWVMQVRRKMIGGQTCCEIVEAYHHRGEVEYRSAAPLGTDPDSQEALLKHQASLIEMTRALTRLQPLQDTGPAIRRKCDTLAARLKGEQERIGLLIDAIARLDDTSENRPTDQPESDDPSEAETA
jgi:hypothetical protein